MVASLAVDGAHYFNKCWRHAAGYVTSSPLRTWPNTGSYLVNLLAKWVLSSLVNCRYNVCNGAYNCLLLAETNAYTEWYLRVGERVFNWCTLLNKLIKSRDHMKLPWLVQWGGIGLATEGARGPAIPLSILAGTGREICTKLLRNFHFSVMYFALYDAWL